MSDLLQSLVQADTELLLRLNGAHNGFWDFIMYWFSNRSVWIPFYLLLLWIVFRTHGRNSWWILLAVGLMILVSDQLSVHLFKNQVMRLRPCHEPALQGMIRLVKGVCGGQYGFVSSHAANTFSLAVFLFGFFIRQSRWLAWSLIAWAAAISYSRIYLGVHYPGDVLAGILFGILMGLIFRKITLYWLNSRTPSR